MKRRDFFKLAGLGAGTMALSSCSAAGWGVEGGNKGVVELTYALWDATQQVGYQKSVNEFQRRNPGIHVTIEQIPYGNYQQKITAQYISHNAPDVFWVNTPWMGDWVTSGVLTDITDRIHRAGIDLDQYLPSLVELHSRNSRIYGLPKDWDTIAIFYNATHLARCGFNSFPQDLSWNPTDGGSYLHFLKQITLDKKGHNALDPNFDPRSVVTYATAMPNDLQSTYGNYFAMNGGSILPRPFATRSTLDSPENLEALNFMISMLQGAHVIVPGAESGPNGDATNAQTLFASQRMALWQNGDWQITGVSQLSGFKIAVAPMPKGPKGRISVINGLIDGIASNTRHPEEAWKLVEWLGSAESQRMMGAGGYVWPAIKSLDALFLEFWKRKGIDMTPFLDASRGATVNYPVASGIQEGLTNVTTALGPAFLQQAKVAPALKQAASQLDYRISYNV